jgi:hypothetical protein
MKTKFEQEETEKTEALFSHFSVFTHSQGTTVKLHETAQRPARLVDQFSRNESHQRHQPPDFARSEPLR